MKSIGTRPVCKNQIGPARGIHTIGPKDYHPTCDDNRQAQSATPTLDQDREPAGKV